MTQTLSMETKMTDNQVHRGIYMDSSCCELCDKWIGKVKGGASDEGGRGHV